MNQKIIDNLDKTHFKEDLERTPSTICNYYDTSSNKNKTRNNDKVINDEIKKNLECYYYVNNEKRDPSNVDKKNKIHNINVVTEKLSPNSSNKNNNKIGKNNNNCLNYNYYANYSKSTDKIKGKKDGIINKNQKINENNKILAENRRKSQNKFYNKMKYGKQFTTPRNINNPQFLNIMSSTKIKTNSYQKGKFSRPNKKIKYINSNKTTPKKNCLNKEEKLQYYIQVNLKHNPKSSTNLNNLNKEIYKIANDNWKAVNNFNHKKNRENKKINLEEKNSISILKGIYNSKKQNVISSPLNSEQDYYKISKTMTEQNLIMKPQTTPKNYKIQNINSKKPLTTNFKKINSRVLKDNHLQFHSSLKKGGKTKTEQIISIFQPKTQSGFKSGLYKKYNNEYGNEGHVKQKLLDRMNKATNNWQYIFRGNKNKIDMNDGLSNFKGHIHNFYKNENIISDGSEKEDDNDILYK
jgi:hypothetical protein